MHPAPLGSDFRGDLLRRLAKAGIDMAALWKAVESDNDLSGRLAVLMNSPCFSHPADLARAGYPKEAVEEALETARRTIDRSFATIVEIAERVRTEATPEKNELVPPPFNAPLPPMNGQLEKSTDEPAPISGPEHEPFSL